MEEEVRNSIDFEGSELLKMATISKGECGVDI
jgi:hypothetical protein